MVYRAYALWETLIHHAIPQSSSIISSVFNYTSLRICCHIFTGVTVGSNGLVRFPHRHPFDWDLKTAARLSARETFQPALTLPGQDLNGRRYRRTAQSVIPHIRPCGSSAPLRVTRQIMVSLLDRGNVCMREDQKVVTLKISLLAVTRRSNNGVLAPSTPQNPTSSVMRRLMSWKAISS